MIQEQKDLGSHKVLNFCSLLIICTDNSPNSKTGFWEVINSCMIQTYDIKLPSENKNNPSEIFPLQSKINEAIQ